MSLLAGCATQPPKANFSSTPVQGEAFSNKYPLEEGDPFRLNMMKQPSFDSDYQPEELKTLLGMKSKNSEGSSENSSFKKLRPDAIKEVARLVALQTGISWRYEQLMNETKKYNHILDQTFNFAPLVIIYGDTLVLPPVLSSAGSSIRVESSTTATTALKTYEMLHDARFITAVPSWREYLMANNFPQPEQAHMALLPRTSEEKAIWKGAIKEGWQLGVEQADELYRDNIFRLVRDYKGILLYHMLAAEKLLTEPKLADSAFNTHISKNKMFINQRVFKIVGPSRFNPNSAEWEALVKKTGKE